MAYIYKFIHDDEHDCAYMGCSEIANTKMEEFDPDKGAVIRYAYMCPEHKELAKKMLVNGGWADTGSLG